MGVKEDVIELKKKLSGLQEDPEKFRAAIAALLLVVGMLVIKIPLTARINGKQTALREAQHLAEVADQVMVLRDQAALVEERLRAPGELSDWGVYVEGLVNQSGADLSRQEGGDVDGIHSFKKISIGLTITGTYREIWAFIDAVESGPRLARLENIDLSVSEGTLTLRCMFLGLCDPNMGGAGPMEDEMEAEPDA